MDISKNLPLDEISRLGEKFYTEELKDTLEGSNLGDYIVVDVENKRYKINADRLIAVQEAQREFGNKLFYIIQIGGSGQFSMNFMAKKYAWHF